jgi:hypothetical protein
LAGSTRLVRFNPLSPERSDANTSVPADIVRLERQIDVGAAHTEKVVTFEFTHYLMLIRAAGNR